MYSDYEFYSTVYHGKLTETEYTPCAEKAGAYINARTDFIFEKNGLPDPDTSLARRLKVCSCELTDEMHRVSTAADTLKTSEKVGNYSVTYAAASSKSSDERLNDVIMMYLPDAVKAVKWL